MLISDFITPSSRFTYFRRKKLVIVRRLGASISILMTNYDNIFFMGTPYLISVLIQNIRILIGSGR
jgi:hypothetical protein